MSRRSASAATLGVAAVLVAAMLILRAAAPVVENSPIVACSISGGEERVVAVRAESASRPAVGGGSASRVVGAAAFVESRRAAFGGALVLRVVDAATEAPVADARAEAYRVPQSVDRPVAEVRSGADGVAAFAGLPSPAVDVVVSSTGYAPFYARVRLTPGRPRAELTVALRPLPRIPARVVDESGAPIAGARVRARGSDGPTEVTAGDGSFAVTWFVFPNTDPGATHVFVDVEHPDFAPHAAAYVRDGTIVLPRTRARLRGSVRTPLGTPVAGAAIAARSRLATAVVAEARRSATVRSGPDGAFELPELSPGPLEIEVVADGCFRWFAPPVVVFPSSTIPELSFDPRAEPAPLAVVLSRQRLVRGEVRWSDGPPCVGAAVEAIGYGHQWTSSSPGPTDDLGGFQIALPEDDAASFAVTPPLRQTHVSAAATADADGVLRLVLPREAVRRGRILDAESGLPVAGADVALWDGWMWGPGSVRPSDADGFVEVYRSERTTQRWILRSDGYAPASVDAAVPESGEPLTVLLVRAGAVGGFVGKNSAVEVRRFDDTAPEDPRLGFHRERAVADALGYVEIDDLAPGTYRFTLFGSDGAPAGSRVVDVVAGAYAGFGF